MKSGSTFEQEDDWSLTPHWLWRLFGAKVVRLRTRLGQLELQSAVRNQTNQDIAVLAALSDAIWA